MTIVPITSPDLAAAEVSFSLPSALMIISILACQMVLCGQAGHIVPKLSHAQSRMVFVIFCAPLRIR